MTEVQVVIGVDYCTAPRVIVYATLNTGALTLSYLTTIVGNYYSYGD
jgi:hypothetical protein